MARTEQLPLAAPAASRPPRWVPPTTMLLSLAGFGVSVYLTLTHYASGAVSLYCSDRGAINCAKVTTSPQSMVFGVIPVAVLGLAFYASMLVLQSPPAWRSPRRAVRWLRLASAVIGVGFICYLIYAELFVINAVCLWCTSVHAITLVLFAVTAIGTAASLPAEEWAG